MEETNSIGLIDRKGRIEIAVLLLCVLAGNLPFINQAFHIDDGIYLLLARNVELSHWFPQDRPTYFEGLYGKDLASTEHPLPLTSYWMTLISYLTGRSTEVVLHLGFLIFPLILACSMYLLARHFTSHPLLVSLTFMFLPVVFVVSHTLMTDIPQLALSVASVASVLVGIHSRRAFWVWLGAVAVTLACFVSYSSLCLVPLLAFYAIQRKDRRSCAIILIVPAVLFGIWLGGSYRHYGRLLPGQILGFYFFAKRVLTPRLIIQKSIYSILTIGGVTIFPFSLLAVSRKQSTAMALPFVYPALWISDALQYPLTEKVLFGLFFCAGFAGIVECIRRFRSGSAEDRFLGIWLVGILFFAAAAYITGAARYLLLAMPPLVLLFFRMLEQRSDDRTFRWIGWSSLILGATLALAMAHADYQFASTYRNFAATIHRFDSTQRRRLWFTGEWGFRAYLEAAGGSELGRRDARPTPGDILAVPTLATPYNTLFDDTLSVDSIVLLAPSRVLFSVPAVPSNGVLEFTAGMPLAEKSAGLELHIDFEAHGTKRRIYAEDILPVVGRRWAVHQIPLSQIAGEDGNIIFSVDVGEDGNSNGDWLAIARARICGQTANGEMAVYDFQQHLKSARIEPAPGNEYRTPGNVPVFPMTVWLKQEPATVLRSTHNYHLRSPLTLLDDHVHAGFWSMNWGLLPFSPTRRGSIIESVRVYEIIRDVDTYGESDPLWYGQ